jgi:uncharacterized repeat protein (TIGR02543 family)
VRTEVVPDTEKRIVMVVVTPGTGYVVKGDTPLRLTALVAGMNGADIAVDWSVDQTENPNITITPVDAGDDGSPAQADLSVSLSENTVKNIVVTAQSRYYDIFGTAQITVVDTIPAVWSVTVSSATPYARRGGSLQFDANVSGEKGLTSEVLWRVLHNNSENTRINDGNLIVGEDEDAPILVVTARAELNEEVSGAAFARLSYVEKVTVNPGGAVVERKGSRQFAAVVDGLNIPPDKTGVIWSVPNADSGTTIVDGLLTVAESETGTLTLRAASVYDPLVYGEAEVAIAQATGVAVSPQSASIVKGGSLQFSAVVEGKDLSAQNRGVVWTVAGPSKQSGTTISATGLLQAAATEAGPLTVKATSAYDDSKSASVSVTVNGLTVTVSGGSPASYTVGFGGKLSSLPTPTAKGEGYVFKGWYTAAKNGARVTTDTAITKNMTIYAQWLYFTDGGPLNATGGEVKFVKTTNGFDEVHIFRETGTLVVSKAPAGNTVKMLVVAGGGAGGCVGDIGLRAGGGGGGGVIKHNTYTLSAASYTVTVGGGGTAATSASSTVSTSGNGANSSFKQGSSTLFEAVGGGAGANHGAGLYSTGNAGGSAGGSTYTAGAASKTTQSTNGGGTAYGNNGGKGYSGNYDGSAGGGGGAGGAGQNATASYAGGTGGVGVSSDITGVSVYYGGGGAGGGASNTSVSYGANGGRDGTANTGDGGGGGGSSTLSGGKGGSGIVVVCFPYQYTGY